MEIRDWAPANVGELAHVYNAQVASPVPHCYPVAQEDLQAGCYEKTGDDYSSVLDAERVIVGIRGGQMRGFAHVRVGEIKHGEKILDGGLIHFLTYEPGHRALGQAILETCEQHVHLSGASTIRAFDGYFYRFHHLGFPLASDRMAHVCALFGQNGYKLARKGDLFLEQRSFAAAEPGLPEPDVEVQVQVLEGRGDRPNITVRALRDGHEIGSCIAISGGDYNRADEAQALLFVDGLGVIAPEQGQGWGRYLLTRTLWEARKLGYEHTAISTGKRNYRAQLFYSNYGYRMTDTVYGFVKEEDHLCALSQA
jgi:GNAT superfamily N-acetyltransferase